MWTGLYNFSFLQKWMFEGLCQDAYTEFFIQEQPDLMTCRQRDYWSRGYYMLEEAVPGFLRGLESAIFECGKAVNLLKLCNPQVRIDSHSVPLSIMVRCLMLPGHIQRSLGPVSDQRLGVLAEVLCGLLQCCIMILACFRVDCVCNYVVLF